jgi:hypothetical protein
MSLGRAFTALKSLGVTPAEPAPPAEKPAEIKRGPKEGISPPASHSEQKLWTMLDKPAEEWDLDAMYTEARGGVPVSEEPLVCIVMPKYRETDSIAEKGRVSRGHVRQDLAEYGINSFPGSISGDSLVCRMRQRACHSFLMSPATHMLFWDADIECLTPDCVRHMLASGHDVVAGACPFKDMSGRTVHNLVPGTDMRSLKTDEHACLEVMDCGTGFMLISRRCLYAMQKAYPQLLHSCLSMGAERGAPMWSLFDTFIAEHAPDDREVTWRDRAYLSEDYHFCHLWQLLGGSTYVYVPARFKHWGDWGFEASIEKQYGLTLESK